MVSSDLGPVAGDCAGWQHIRPAHEDANSASVLLNLCWIAVPDHLNAVFSTIVRPRPMRANLSKMSGPL